MSESLVATGANTSNTGTAIAGRAKQSLRPKANMRVGLLHFVRNDGIVASLGNHCLMAGMLALVAVAALGEGKEEDLSAQSFQRGLRQSDEGQLSFLHRLTEASCLVLIPGSYSDATQWTEVVSGLDRELSLVLIEVRGHGESWPPPANGSIEQFAQDVLRVTDALGVKEFYVGGHSIGGMVALEVGRQQPESVKGIISIEGWTNRDAAGDAFGGRMYSTLTPELEAQRQASRARVTAKWTKEQIQAFGKIWTQWDGSNFLRTTDLPILEIYGDRGNEPATREQLRIPERENIEMLWVEGASHSLPLERPQALAEAIARFITRFEEQPKN